MMIEPVTHWHIPRVEDENTGNLYRSEEFSRLVTHALRWWPEPWTNQQEEDDLGKGRSALRSLEQGQPISSRQLGLAIEFLRRSAEWYEAGPWDGVEPFEGRNAEAASDLRALLAEVDVEVTV